ncbi:hypothetical protein [Rhodanobacter hydrolyticus]|uniref:Uncharacterized protein n=1 Tax=Rhodanobacter hydrolyticus TaxID=2250595 RepID=A0ABW8J3Y4_9GAMM
MSDMGEMYADWRAMKREKKASNLASSTDLLRERGVDFEQKNDGVHLIVRGVGNVVDFWPSTGKFIVRGGRTGRGVFNLLRIVQPKASA